MKRLYKGEVKEGMKIIIKGVAGLSEDPNNVYMVFEEVSAKVNFRVGDIDKKNSGIYWSRWADEGFEVWQVDTPIIGCEVKDSSKDWTDSHYNHNYILTKEDIENGFVKLDVYKVAKVWKIGSKDDSGALWHTFKIFPRFGEKNSREREVIAMYKQIKALAEIEGVKLD